jgi:hypothetical protein
MYSSKSSIRGTDIKSRLSILKVSTTEVKQNRIILIKRVILCCTVKKLASAAQRSMGKIVFVLLIPASVS